MKINGKECIKHTISISDYVKAEIYIPEDLDILEFKAITTMANQLIKMNITDENRQTTPTTIKESNKWGWTQDKINTLSNLINNGLNNKEIAEKMKVKRNRIDFKISQLQLRKNKIPNIIKSNSSLSINEKISIYKKWKKSKSIDKRKEIAQKCGKTLAQLHKSIYNWKRNAKIRGNI